MFNDWFARDTSKKIKAVFKAKGQSGKHLGRPPYGYKSSEQDKNVWEIDDEAAVVVRSIFQMCIDGLGPAQIARKLREQEILIPTAYAQSNGSGGTREFKSPTRWGEQTVNKILDRIEYAGHTANFKTHKKSYKNKKRIENPKSEWLIFENTHPAIISQHDFDLVSELRRNKRKIQKCGEVNPFSGMVYCADCGARLYLQRQTNPRYSNLDCYYCGTYKRNKNVCTNHRVLLSDINEILSRELRFITEMASNNLDELVKLLQKNSKKSNNINHGSLIKEKAVCEKRIAEIDLMIKKLFEQSVIGGLTSERFSSLTADYENEQKMLKEKLADLTQKLSELNETDKGIDRFIAVAKRYADFETLTPEIIISFVDKIFVHQMYLDDNGEKCQQIDIVFNFIGGFEYDSGLL